MSLVGLVINIVKWIFSGIKRHPNATKAVGIAGVAAGAGGAALNVGARKLNKKALSIRNEAISKYERELKITEEMLKALGDLQLEIIETFPDFVDVLEKIQGRPRGLLTKIVGVSLPEYKARELKDMANNAQMVMAGAGGAAVGVGIGLAAFGINMLALGPAAFVGGTVFCVKGASLANKAIKNKRQAKQLSEEVNEIVKYLQKLRSSASELYTSMKTVQESYNNHLSKIKILVLERTDWASFDREEKKLMQNTIMLISLLDKMCKVELVQKAKNEAEIESVNVKAVRNIVKEAKTKLTKL